MTKNLWVAAAFLAIAGLGASQAAEKIRYEELPKRLAPFNGLLPYRGITVTTIDGKKYSGRRLLLESDHVRIFDRKDKWHDLFSDQIAQIEISQRWRFIHHVEEGADFALLPLIGCLESNAG